MPTLRNLIRPCSSNRVSATLLLVAMLLTSLVDTSAARSDLQTPAEFHTCEIGDPATRLMIRAECTSVTVAENPQNINGKNIELFVARLSARSNDKRGDPLTILAGGPGQSATESYPSVQIAFEKLRKNRDIYLIDQRGTGQSNRLDCPEPDDTEANHSVNFDPDQVEQDSQLCLDNLTGDPRFYTTSVAVQDLEYVRETLGIAKWNLYGISYGTRVGLHYLRMFPDSVRTMILDAVVPPDKALGEDIAAAAQQSLDQMMQRCRRDEACNKRFPDLKNRTSDLIAALKIKPREISFENFTSGKLETLEFTAEHLTLTIRMLSYSSHGVSILPVLLHDAYTNNNFAPLARQSSLQAKKLTQTIAGGMHNAVICTEDQPFITLSDELRIRLDQTYLGDTPIEALAATCKNWPAGIIDDNFKQPVSSEKPILILSGGSDPVTPPEYGDAIAHYLPNSLHIVNPWQGHMQAWLGCMPDVMSNFVERGNTKDVDFGCLERQTAEPFFVDANGPTP